MPDPKTYADEKEWMGACVPKRIGEGDEQDQAVAVCMGMWARKAKEPDFVLSLDNLPAIKAEMTEAEMRAKIKRMMSADPRAMAMMKGKDPDTMSMEEMQTMMQKMESMGMSPRGERSGEPMKAGARHSATDQTHIDKAVEHLIDAGGDHPKFHRPEDAILGALGGKPMKADTAIMLDIPAFEWAWVKASGDWELDVLGVPFGGPYNGKDAQRQYFSAKTNLYLDFFKSIPAMYFHSVKPDGKSLQSTPEIIGKAHYDHTDAKGHWFKVVLDKTKALATRVWEAAKKGMARASSGSVQHLVRIASDGEILSWPIAELSLLDTGEGRTAINPYAVAMPAAKAVYQSAGMLFPALPDDDEPETTASGGISDAPAKSTLQGVIEMDEKELSKFMAEAFAKHDADLAAKATAEQAEKDREATAVKAAVEKVNAEWAAKMRIPGGMPYVAQFADTWKYENLSPAELALVVDTLKSSGRGVASPGAYKALALKLIEDKRDFGNRDLGPGYSLGAMKAAGINPTVEAIKAATDPMYTGGTTDGAYWTGTAYARELWGVIRAETAILAKIPSVTIPDGYVSQYFPIEGADPTWYKVAEASASEGTLHVPEATITASQATTPAQRSMTVGKIGCRVLYSGEMTEDALIGFVPQLRGQIVTGGKEQLEHLVIDGDTTTTAYTNINDIGNSSVVTAGTLFLTFDGLRHVALTSNSRAGGALDEDDFLETMWLLGTAGIGGADMAKCGFVVDPNVYKKSLMMASVKTKDVWANATLEKGVLTSLWGYSIFPSWFMQFKSATRKANSAGKVDQTTPANNAYGAILGVRWDQWKFGYKRQMTIETTRIANADAWEIVALARVGLLNRDTSAASITYGLTV